MAHKVLNKLKEMKAPYIYIPLGTQFKEASQKAFVCASSKKAF
jgi:hypothetical protein